MTKVNESARIFSRIKASRFILYYCSENFFHFLEVHCFIVMLWRCPDPYPHCIQILARSQSSVIQNCRLDLGLVKNKGESKALLLGIENWFCYIFFIAHYDHRPQRYLYMYYTYLPWIWLCVYLGDGRRDEGVSCLPGRVQPGPVPKPQVASSWFPSLSPPLVQIMTFHHLLPSL